jgi:nucleoid DNA-binding protein
VSKATAQDRVDEVVYQILKRLRSGKPVALPGVGKLVARTRVDP